MAELERYSGKNVLVAGLARSGICAARLLAECGANVTVYDIKTELPGAKEALDSLPIQWALGEDPAALCKKADLTVISPGIPSNTGWVSEAIAQGRDVIGEVELGYRLSKGTVIGITGTNGKTTTTALVGEIFKNAGKLTHVVGNIGAPITGIANTTRPEDVIVTEVSSFQLETIKSFRPRVSAVLNISEDHINRHGTMDEYIRLKARILENQREGDTAVLNYDDPVTREMGDNALCNVLYFSLEQKPPKGGAWLEEGNVRFRSGGGEPRTICPAEDIKIPGRHNLQNALAALCVALAMEVPPPVIRHTLRTFTGAEHRIEMVREIRGVRYINDSKGTNVDAAIKAVQAMNRPTVLIAGGYDKQTDFTPLAKVIRENPVFHVVLIGQTAEQIKNTLIGCGYESYTIAHTLEEAVHTAADMSGEGGNVLLSPACASFDQFADYEERGRVFKQIVRDLL